MTVHTLWTWLTWGTIAFIVVAFVAACRPGRG